MKLIVLDHPLIQHKLTFLRNKETKTKEFKEFLNEIALLVGYELFRDIKLKDIHIDTPISKNVVGKYVDEKVILVPILRAGLGMVEGINTLIPNAKVAHIGLYRDPKSHLPIEYYSKFPNHLDKGKIIVIDPMLATGGTASKAIDILKEKGAKNITLVCLLTSKQGVEFIFKNHPDITIYTTSSNEELNKNDYLVPGLGDAGDRIFGTK